MATSCVIATQSVELNDSISMRSDDIDPQVNTFIDEVIAEGATVRIPGLLKAPPPGVLYHLPNRHGVSTIAVLTTDLNEEEVAALLLFRFAQYLDVGFIDKRLAYTRGMRSEPIEVMRPGDVHIISGVQATGEILGYTVIEQPPKAPSGCRLRSADRELFSVEQVHGHGIYNRLPILQDLAVNKIRDVGRFMRNNRPSASAELRTRAVSEVGLALYKVIAGPLRWDIDAIIGDMEKHAVQYILDFFHAPYIQVHRTVPYISPSSYLYPRYQGRMVCPFALLVSDYNSALPRLAEIEHALDQPGKLAVLALLRLKKESSSALSLLRPLGSCGTAEDDLRLPQPELDMEDCGNLLEKGALLRKAQAFASLSKSEAALIASRMHSVELLAGQRVGANAFFFIQRGEGTIVLRNGKSSRCVGTIGPGQCSGHVAILVEEQPIDIVAQTGMTLLRLSKHDFETHLLALPDVRDWMQRDALRQMVDRGKCHRRRPMPTNATTARSTSLQKGVDH